MLFYEQRIIDGKKFVVDPWNTPISSQEASELLKMMGEYIVDITPSEADSMRLKIHNLRQHGVIK